MPRSNIPAPTPFNPLDRRNLADSITRAILATQVQPLPPAPFLGAGIYAIYYTGNLDMYAKLTEANRDGKFLRPIYVGKAVPSGARTGGQGFNVSPENKLQSRLRQHAQSISSANNLNINDFSCRYLVVDDIWIPLAESMLIEMFSPVWNIVLDGFGNHALGSGRDNQRLSKWDYVHPGRDSDATRINGHDRDELVAKIIQHLNDTVLE